MDGGTKGTANGILLDGKILGSICRKISDADPFSPKPVTGAIERNDLKVCKRNAVAGVTSRP